MEFEIDGVTAHFFAGTEGWILKQLDGKALNLSLPAILPDGGALCGIADKALFGQNRLTALTIPDSVRKIGDWAMAGCPLLKEVKMPACDLGKGVFRDCNALERIDTGAGDESAALLAEAARQDAAYLFSGVSPGSAEWFERWDGWLKRFLDEDDQEGYSGQVPCGEEDYWNFDVASYESSRRKEKARRCLLRLMNPSCLSHNFRDELRFYIREHSAGSSKGDEAWQLILHQYAEEEEWYAAFAEAGGIHDENTELLLADIPESFAGMKSYFLRYRTEHKEGDSLWERLEL